MGKIDSRKNKSSKKQEKQSLSRIDCYHGTANLENNSIFSLLAQEAFQQIQNPPYNDPELKKRYIDAKMQEWEVHIQADLKYDANQENIQSNDILIYTVQQFLLANIKSPPSLVQLAHRFGTNEKKLNKRFKQVSNMTVFYWIREQRMQKAVNLLKEDKESIKKIASVCGFKHQSDFTTSFKKKFQLTPMAFKNKIQ